MTDDQTSIHARELFSVVVPLFRTEQYVGELLRSFDRQLRGDYDLEFIFVDDGSDDNSADVAQAWLDRSPFAGQVIRQTNTGVAGARNRGIDAASGTWITFPDSDDFLSDEYFHQAARVLAETADDVVLLTANVHRFLEATERKYDDHPLRFKFRGGLTSTDLEQRPDFIQTQTASAFFRMDVIRDNGVRFVDGLTVAEDAIFASTYLLHAPTTVVAPLRESIYYYRKRASADSAADSYRLNPDFYFGRFERGYLPLLAIAESTAGRVPRWLQNIILYDLGWYLPREMNRERKATHLTAEEKARAIELLQAVLAKIDGSAIINYRITWISHEVRALLLTLAGKELPAFGTVRISKNVPGEFELTYLYQGERPAESLECNAGPVTPLSVKTRQLDYFGQRLLHERIIRLPAAMGVHVLLDGKQQLLRYGSYYLGSSEASSKQAAKQASKQAAKHGPKQGSKQGAKRAGSPDGTSLSKQILIRAAAEVSCFTRKQFRASGVNRKGANLRSLRYRTFIRNLARTPHFKRKYQDAWLVMDKIRAGNDNGEYLFQYLRDERPDVNAWFVVEKDTPEWKRMKGLGYRLIAYRSTEHKVALQNAALVASSQLDVEIVQPVANNFYPRSTRPWRFVYLQHGVLQHNLAHWFNTKDIDLMTTASVDEHESIVEDGGTYKLTSDSVVLTGFPRHDAVARLGERQPFDRRAMVLVAPTWRNDLFLPKASFGAQRQLREPFLDSGYGRNWMGFLSHPLLKALVDEQGAEIVYLPHPNFRGNTPGVTFPDYVTVIESTPDIHQLMSRSKVTVTDYSSIFFDAALAQSRIVYFQFDQEAFLNGSHTYLPGYWDYSRHGFGPIATEVDEAVELTLGAFSADGSAWPEVYEQRVRRTLPMVDGGAAKRIVDTIGAKLKV